LIIYVLSRNYLKTATDKASEGLRLGLVFAVVNFALDLLILVLLFKNGFSWLCPKSVNGLSTLSQAEARALARALVSARI
jgi:hypothetical protein